MQQSSPEILDGYGFHFLQDVASPAFQLSAIGIETRSTAEYHFDNRERHPGHLLQYTLSGSGRVRIGSKTVTVGPESAFLLSFPGDHEYYFDPISEEKWTFVFMVFGGDKAETYADYIRERTGSVLPLSAKHPAAKQLLELHALAKAGQITDAFTAGKWVFSILCALCSPQADDGRAPSALVGNAMALLQENFRRRYGISEAARALHVSQSHLSREFVKETGIQPVLYLTRLRLEEAARLLSATNLSVGEISEQCGFDNGNYFCKVFRKHMNLTPREFRRILENQPYASVKL